MELLTDDAVSIADGGGKVQARTTPIVGALQIARFVRGLFQQNDSRRELVHSTIGGSPQMYVAVVNGGPALVFVSDDRVVGVLFLDVTVDGIAALHTQANPDKLERITRQWATTEHGEPTRHGLVTQITLATLSGIAALSGSRREHAANRTGAQP